MSNLACLPTTKCCNVCKEFLSFDLFSKDNTKKDKLSNKCKNCDKIYQEKQRRKTPEHKLQYSREYQKNRRKDFNYRLQMLINASKQIAKKKNIEHTLTVEDLKELYPIDNKCPVFGTFLEFGTAGFRDNSPSVDRINPKGGYTKENVQILSWKANRLKTDATVKELEMLLYYLKQGE
jgi:uncharacterized protein YbaR (Trm112 family)